MTINIQSLREKIGLVNQEIFLFDGSIKENICYPNEDINESLLNEVAHSSQCMEFIEKLPHGFNTLIGERGQKLSVGQKQRIGIARALYEQADVLILDEATSQLDVDTERKVIESIKASRSNMTILMISHRITTLESCDQVIKLDKNYKIKIGSYKEVTTKFH